MGDLWLQASGWNWWTDPLPGRLWALIFSLQKTGQSWRAWPCLPSHCPWSWWVWRKLRPGAWLLIILPGRKEERTACLRLSPPWAPSSTLSLSYQTTSKWPPFKFWEMFGWRGTEEEAVVSGLSWQHGLELWSSLGGKEAFQKRWKLMPWHPPATGAFPHCPKVFETLISQQRSLVLWWGYGS